MLQWFSTSFWAETATQSALHVSCVWLLLFCEERESSRRASQLQAVPVELGAPWQWVGWIGNEDWWRSGGCCGSKLYIRTRCNYGLEKSSEHSKLCSWYDGSNKARPRVAKGDYYWLLLFENSAWFHVKDIQRLPCRCDNLPWFACFCLLPPYARNMYQADVPLKYKQCNQSLELLGHDVIYAYIYTGIYIYIHIDTKKIHVWIYTYLLCIILPYEFICMFFDHWPWLYWNRKNSEWRARYVCQ